MVCPNCKSENKNTNIKCEKCRTVLIDESEFEDIPEELLIDETDPVTDAKVSGAANIFRGTVYAIVSIIFINFIGYLFFSTESGDIVSKIVLLPFLICGIIIFISSITYLIGGIKNIRNVKETVGGEVDIEKIREDENRMNKGQNILSKMYMSVFMVFWFGFLIVFDVNAIKSWSNGGNQLFYFSLMFWIVGIFSFIQAFRKK